MMKIPAMPCVSHGACSENHVVGAGCGTIGGATGAAGGTAPRGNAEAAADGTAWPAAVATIKRGFIAASSLRPHPSNRLLLHDTSERKRNRRGARIADVRRSVRGDRSHQETGRLARTGAQPLDDFQPLFDGVCALRHPRSHRGAGYVGLLALALRLAVFRCDRSDAVRILAERERPNLRPRHVGAGRARDRLHRLRDLRRSRSGNALAYAGAPADDRSDAGLYGIDADRAIHHSLLEDQHARDRHHRSPRRPDAGLRPSAAALHGFDPNGLLGARLSQGAYDRTSPRRRRTCSRDDCLLLLALSRRSALRGADPIISVEFDAIVIGAGAAGLSAARTLAEHSLRVAVVEARDRIGGRALTVPTPRALTPAELGAEFIHGTGEQTLRLLRDDGMAA